MQVNAINSQEHGSPVTSSQWSVKFDIIETNDDLLKKKNNDNKSLANEFSA